MHNIRALGFVCLALIALAIPSAAKTDDTAKNPSKKDSVKKAQQVVESVDVQGNRRLRDRFLLGVVVENRRAILRAGIGPLAVQRGRVVDREEHFE